MSRRMAVVFSLCLVMVISCKPRFSSSTVKEIPTETINNLVLEFGFGQKLVFAGAGAWTKFVVTLADNEVYFMNANEQKFHYEFATKYIDKFRNLSPAQFDQMTLQSAGRTGVSGGVININGVVAFDLVSKDPLEHAFAVKILNLVKSRVFSDSELKFSYMPAFNQSADAFASRTVYEGAGFRMMTMVEATEATQVYSKGWAYGRIVKVPAAQIDAEYANGGLKTTDILFTDGIPAEIPVLAGIISSAPATPNAHVAILAKSFQIPFVYTRDEQVLARVESVVGKEALLKISGNDFWGNVEVAPLALSSADRTALKTLKTPEGLKFPEKKSYRTAAGKISKPVTAMLKTDAHYFGGKAVNFKVLSLATPDNYPKEAIGLSFDVWDGFMDGAKIDGKSVREYVALETAGLTFPPANVLELKAKLKDIRERIKKADFPAELRTEVVQVLKDAQFASDRKIRFRSSTNVEDGESFSGAGLYDSFSGCLGDEGSSATVSACAAQAGPEDGDDSNKPKPVTKAVKKVFASFFNDNAFIERLRRGVKPQEVGMAMAVHYSFPDEGELANGVITTEPHDNFTEALVVSQVGAESVTNPALGSGPEKVGLNLSAQDGQLEVFINVREYSQRVTTGRLVLDSQAPYLELGAMLEKLESQFVAFHGLPAKPQLDIEYKMIMTDGQKKLLIKQVRMIPQPKKGALKYYVLGRQIPLCLVQSGSFGGGWDEGMGNHFLKGSGSVTARSGWLTDLVRRRDFITAGHIEIERGSAKKRLDLNRLTRSETRLQTTDGFSALKHEAGGQRELFGQSYNFKVGIEFPLDDEMPIVFSGKPTNILGSGALMVNVGAETNIEDYAGTAKKLAVNYYACDENPAGGDLISKSIRDGDVQVDVQYRFSIGTFFKQEQNLAEWGTVKLTGLTTIPFELRNASSRTYFAGHHNFHDSFLLEPALDPTVPPAIIQELRAKNIRAIYAETSMEEAMGIRLIGFDNVVRKAGPNRAMLTLPLPGGQSDQFDDFGGGDPLPAEGSGFSGRVSVPENAPQGLIGF